MNICRKVGVTEPSLYRRKRKYAGIEVAGLRWLKELAKENTKRKRRMALPTMDKHLPQGALRKKF